MRVSILRMVLLAAMALAISACASSPVQGIAQDIPVLQPYKLGTGDKLRITVFNEPTLSGEYTISDTGIIALPLIGETAAAGSTVQELNNEIVTQYGEGFLNNPRITVEVLNYRPYYVLGEVNKPGQYPYATNLTVLNAVAAAEGFTYRANMRRVFIKRSSDVVERELPLTTTTTVQPGDTIRIAERFF